MQAYGRDLAAVQAPEAQVSKSAQSAAAYKQSQLPLMLTSFTIAAAAHMSLVRYTHGKPI